MRFEYVSLPAELADYELVGTPAAVAAPSPAPTAPAAAKSDPQVSFAGATPAGVFSFDIGPYDLATYNRVNAIHVVPYPKDQPIPDSAEQAVKDAPLHYQTDTSAIQGGARVAVDASAAPAGRYSVLAIVELDA